MALRPLVAALSASGLFGSVGAQTLLGQAVAKDHGFQPYASAEVTLTDNYALSSAKSADAVTRLTAGVSYQRNTGRFRMRANYGISGVVYAGHGSQNTFQNQLAAELDGEWWERRGFIRAQATIQQLANSAFAPQPTANGLPVIGNARELRSLSVSPRLETNLPAGLKLDLIEQSLFEDAKGTDLGDVQSHSVAARLSPQAVRQFSWTLDAAHVRTEYDLTRSTQSSRAYASAIWLWPAQDLRVFGQAGTERANYTTSAQRRYNTWAFGAKWTPSVRTQVDAQYGQRSFGRTHQVQALYRTPRMVWTLSDSRDISAGGSNLVDPRSGILFDFVYEQAARLLNDFVRGAELADLFFALNPQISRTQRVFAGSLYSNSTVTSRQNLSVLMRGPRSDLLASLTHTDTELLAIGLFGQLDPFASRRVRQDAFNLALTHRLSPAMTGLAGLDVIRSRGDRNNERLRQEGLRVQVTGKVSAREQWSLGWRFNQYHVVPNRYNENALTASYGVRF